MRKRLHSHGEIVNEVRSAFIDMVLKKPRAPFHTLSIRPAHPARMIPYGRNVNFRQLAEKVNRSAQLTTLHRYIIRYDGVRQAFIATHKHERSS